MSEIIFGKILRADLSKGTFSQEIVDKRDVRDVMGGRGLGSLLLYRELASGIDPLGPDNKLIFSTGPLTGTTAPGNGKIIVNTKSPLTGIYLFSVSGGDFGSRLRASGYDAVIIEGKAKSPVYLYVKDGVATLRDASKVWGRGTQLTQELIKEDLHDDGASISCIGPAGERLVPYAASINERRALGRGGIGAVMGSKNLKAIVVNGSQKPFVAYPDEFSRAVKQSFLQIQDSPLTKSGKGLFSRLGSPAMLDLMNEAGVYPIKNYQEVRSSEARRLSAEELRKHYLIKDVACSTPCPVRCSKYYGVKDGPRAGAFSEGPEYETLYSFGGMIGNYDLASIIELDALCDDLGLDTISAGVSIAFAMECFERGIITKQDTGGLDLRFGNVDCVFSLLRDIAFNRGFGAVVGQGSRHMAEQFGQGSEAFAMHCKGMELGGYDPRGAKGMVLVFAVGPRGGCHHGGGFPIIAEVMGNKYDRFSEEEEKSALVANTRNRRVSFCDAFPMCSFTAAGVGDSCASELISTATGIEITAKNIYEMGERISNIERMFNCREGIRRENDTLPQRFLKETLSCDDITDTKVENIDKMLDDYYALLGWDLNTGVPTPEKLKEMNLDWMTGDIWLDYSAGKRRNGCSSCQPLDMVTEIE